MVENDGNFLGNFSSFQEVKLDFQLGAFEMNLVCTQKCYSLLFVLIVVCVMLDPWYS
jgi:hypothetical protein